MVPQDGKKKSSTNTTKVVSAAKTAANDLLNELEEELIAEKPKSPTERTVQFSIDDVDQDVSVFFTTVTFFD